MHSRELSVSLGTVPYPVHPLTRVQQTELQPGHLQETIRVEGLSYGHLPLRVLSPDTREWKGQTRFSDGIGVVLLVLTGPECDIFRRRPEPSQRNRLWDGTYPPVSCRTGTHGRRLRTGGGEILNDPLREGRPKVRTNLDITVSTLDSKDPKRCYVT